MKFFLRNYWIQVIGVFVALFLGSRVVAMALGDVEAVNHPNPLRTVLK